MYPLVESVKIVNNRFVNPGYHNLRLNNTRKILFGQTEPWDIAQYIHIPALDNNKIYKCRFLYGTVPGPAEFTLYSMREINSLRLIQKNDIDYQYKYTARQCFDELRAGSDPSEDILIVKNDLVTDTSFSNIVFYDGAEWITPATPLLAGTKRQFYIDSGIIRPENIRPDDLKFFSRARLINAMIDLETSPDLPIENISW